MIDAMLDCKTVFLQRQYRSAGLQLLFAIVFMTPVCAHDGRPLIASVISVDGS